jgi:hypothetical protein
MKKRFGLSALALALISPSVSAAVGDAEIKSFLGSPGGQTPSASLRACFDAHRASLKAKPNDLAPLVKDYTSGNAEKRLCAIAAEVDFIAENYKLSSPVNGYGPMIGALSRQSKPFTGKPTAIACPTRSLMLEAAKTFDRILGDLVPNYTYEWIAKASNPAC